MTKITKKKQGKKTPFKKTRFFAILGQPRHWY